MFSAPIPANDEARLAELGSLEILDTLPEQSYDDITGLAAFICATPFSTITLVDKDRQWFKSKVGLKAAETNRADSFCACAIVQATTMIVEDALLDPRFASNPFVLGDPNIRFYAGTPLVTKRGYALGTICVFDTKPRVLSHEQIYALEALGRQVIALLELRAKTLESQAVAEALRTAEKLAAVGTLANLIAHELNNPLQSMTNLLFMAQTDCEEGMKERYLSKAQEELERTSQIVAQTLRFHRQSHGPVPTMLMELVKSVRLVFRSRLRHSSLKLKIDDRQTVPLICYSADVRQVIANLIGNALDAIAGMQGSSIVVRMRDVVDQRNRTPGVRLTVADSGCGMDAYTQSRVFSSFFTTKGTRGTGLGLWISKQILDSHGAVVRLKSSQVAHRHGTVVTVFFPHRAEVESAATGREK